MPTRPALHRPAGSARYARARDHAYETSAPRRERHALYDHAWRKYSVGRLARFPLCERCEARGRLRVAVVTDHITPHKGDPALFRDPLNHQSLCKPCHDRKTRVEDNPRAPRALPK